MAFLSFAKGIPSLLSLTGCFKETAYQLLSGEGEGGGSPTHSDRLDYTPLLSNFVLLRVISVQVGGVCSSLSVTLNCVLLISFTDPKWPLSSQ